MDDAWTPAGRDPRPALDAIVFDAGGTLVRLDFEWMSGMLAELGVRASADELRRCEVNGRRRYDARATRPKALPPGAPHPVLGSVAPVEAYFSGLLEAAGCRHPALEEALARVLARGAPPNYLWSRPMEGAREALAEVRDMGLRAACVSNSDGRAEQHLVACDVRDGLEFVLDSQIEGVEKPDPRLFRIALERLGVPPARALYVGDIRSVDEAGAAAAGMHFVLIDPLGDYAGEHTPRVAGIADLPAHVRGRFRLNAAIPPERST